MNAREIQTARADLFQQLATAVRHGLPPSAIVGELAADDQWPRRARAGVLRLARRLEAGDALAKALASESRLFGAEAVALVVAAEALGPMPLADLLAALAVDARRLATASRSVSVTMTWPFTLSLVLLVTLLTCTIYVRPAIQDAFDAMRSTPPLPFAVNTILDTWWAWLPPIYLVLFLWYLGWLPHAVLGLLERVSDGIGFVGRWRAAWSAGRLLEWLSLCDAQPTLRRPVAAYLAATARSDTARAALRRLDGRLEAGMPLMDALSAAGALPARMVLLARLGERSSTLPAVLHDLRRDAGENESFAFVRFERGCIVLFYALIAWLVATLLIGVYLPIFKIGTLI
jgi:type IV pilus assembly protein PilC